MRWLKISIENQTLSLQKKSSAEHSSPYIFSEYPINTAKNGCGEIENSECTPRGEHVIADKIGKNEPVNSFFIARQATGGIYQKGMLEKYPDRDYILTRILRLRGLEEGVNKGFNHSGQCVDSFARYIYIHGSPDDASFEKPASRGCIRMRNKDIMELFDLVQVNDRAFILEKGI